MATTKAELSRWFDKGVEIGATHMVVVCDTYDWDDYPVYVKPGESARETFDNAAGNMQKSMECYALFKPKAPQLAQRRVFDFDQPETAMNPRFPTR